MMDILGEYHNGDGLEFPSQGVNKKKPPFWTLVKQKTLQTNQLIMESTNISNENEQLEKKLVSLKNDHEDIKKKCNLQIAIAAKLTLEKIEREKIVKEYKELIEKQQLKLDENEKHIIQLQCKIKNEEDKNKNLEEIIETTKSKISKKKAVLTKHQECQTTNIQKQDFSINTDFIQLDTMNIDMKDFSANVNFIPKTQMKDFSANANFIKPSPPKPLMIDKNEWTDECITISKEPFPIFCSKCKYHVHPAPIDQILKVMTVPPPVPVSLESFSLNSPTHIKVKSPNKRETKFDVTENQKINQMHQKDQNLPVHDNPFFMKSKKRDLDLEEQKGTNITDAMTLINDLTKRIIKIEKSMKIIKNKKDNLNRNCCPKSFQIVIKNRDDSIQKRNKSHKKQLKRLNRKKILNRKDKPSNKWTVENTEPKRVKILCPKNRNYLKSKSINESELDYLFESPEIDLHETNSISSLQLLDENSSLESSLSLNKEDKKVDISEKSLSAVNITKSILPETEVLSPLTSQISLYKYTYPNNIEKDFDQNMVTNVQSKEKSLTCEYNLLLNKDNDKKSTLEISVNKEDISENKLSSILFCKKGISNINLVKQNGVNSKQVDYSENNTCLNTLVNSKELHYLDDKIICKDNVEEGQTINENSKENSFSDILSYPIVFEESDVSEEELAVCNNIKNQSYTSINNSLPNQENNTVPQTVLENKEVKDNNFDNQFSTKEFMFTSPILCSDIQSNNSTPQDIPSSSGIPLTPESTTPVSNKTLQAKVLFIETNKNNDNLNGNSDGFKSLKNTVLPLASKNHMEAPYESPSKNVDKFSHFLPISKLSVTPKIPGLITEPKTKLRIRGNKIESKSSDNEFPCKNISCVESINSCSETNSKTQHSHIEVKELQSKSTLELFVTPESIIDSSSLKDKIKKKEQSVSTEKDSLDKNHDFVKYENNILTDKADKDLTEENTDDDVSFEELDFKMTHQLPIMTTRISSTTPNPFNDENDTDLYKSEEIESSKIKSNTSEVNSCSDKKCIPENSTVQSSDHIIEISNLNKINDSLSTEPDNEIEEKCQSDIKKDSSITVEHDVNSEENTKESLDKSSNEFPESILSLSPTIKRKKSIDDTNETTNEQSFKVPTKRGRKKLIEAATSTKTSRNLLFTRIRTLKRNTNNSIIPLDIKLEPSVIDVELEQVNTPIIKSKHGIPAIKSIIENPIIKIKKPKSSEKVSTLDNPISTSNKLGNSESDIIPTKKQRIAHKPKSINENLELNKSDDKLIKKPKKSKSPNKELNEADKFSTLLEEYNKTCKERAEYLRLQKEQNSIKSFKSVNLTDFIKCDSNNQKSSDVDMETVSHSYPNENENDKTFTSKTENKDDIVSVPSTEIATTSTLNPTRALRSRQVLLEKEVPETKKLVANHGKRSLNTIPNFIDNTNSSLHDTSVIIVLNESIFFKKLMPRKLLTNNKINEKLVYEQLAILMETKQWTTQTNQQIADILLNSLDLTNLAMHIIDYIENELPNDEIDKEHTPPAPLMTRSEQKMLILILSIDKIHSNFVNVILKGIQYKLFRLGNSPKIQIMTRLVRILVVLNKIRKNREKVRMIICDALYCMKVQALFIIEIVLSSWPEVLPHYSTDNDVMVKTIVHVIMTSLKFDLNKTPFLRLQKLLTSFYKYPNSNYNDEALAIELLKGLEDNVPLVRPSILLLCKKTKPEWTINRIINGIKNILIKRQSSPLLYEDLTLLGNILRSFSTENLTKVSDTIIQLCDILTPYGDGVSDDLQEGIVSCLSSITKFKYEEIALCLMSWQSKKELRNDTRNKLTSFFKMHNRTWWWSFIKKNFSLPNQN